MPIDILFDDIKRIQLWYRNVKHHFHAFSTLSKKKSEMDLKIDKRNISPEKAMATLKMQGVMINREDAALVLDFLYFLALLFYQQHAAEL